MPTFSYREKNVTISVRCGARCRAYHASSMGEGKGPPHNCAPARFLFFGFFNSMESAFPYEESFSVRPNPVRRRLLASGDPDVVLHCPQSLMPSSGSTTSIVRAEPPATRTWCFTARKALFLRPEAPRHLVRLSLRRLGRGASQSAKPYAFVRKHHACWLGPPAPQLASPFSQNLNSSSGHANLAGPSLRRPGRGASQSAKPYSSVRRHHVLGLPFSHKKRMRRTYII